MRRTLSILGALALLAACSTAPTIPAADPASTSAHLDGTPTSTTQTDTTNRGGPMVGGGN